MGLTICGSTKARWRYPHQGGYKKANEAIERERHPIATVEEVLNELNESTAFSWLDLKWGFNQVEVDPQWRRITTFITHRGHYQYKKLMFWITQALEKYQKIIKNTLAGCKGVPNIAYDLITNGSVIQERNDNLLTVLYRLTECGPALNQKIRVSLGFLT